MNGILPGGGTPVQPEVLNALPEAVNMGYRYITGTGNRDLELTDSFKRNAVINALKQKRSGVPTREGDVLSVTPYQSQYLVPGLDTLPPALGKPTFGDKNPEGAPYRYSLGRYNVYDEGDRYTVRDTYDLRNEYESPSMQKKKYDPSTQQWEVKAEANYPEAVVRGLAGVIAVDPASFLRSFINLRLTEPKPYDIEFSVPKEYGVGVGP
jgi:hypothetical protein